MNLDLRAINQCVRCGSCRTFCPVFEESGWESANTRGRIMILKALTCGLQPDSQVLDSLNTCTTCGICTENCPAGVNPPEMIESARRQLVSLGKMTRQQADLSRNILASGNTFAESSDRLSWLTDRSLLTKKADYVYFVGCMNSYRYTETAANTFALLHRFGATILPKELCCGSPLLRTGFDARRFVDENCRQIAETGARTVITGCAGCYTTLKKSYPQDFRVQSVPEFLALHISQLDIAQLDLTVTYHDPCHLGRHNQIYEQPRRVIEAICRLKEMKTSGKAARCCGGGGGVRAGYKDLSLQMARKRLEDVPDGVDYIVASCPLCIRNLRDAGAGEKVIDLVDLVAMAVR
ncbi:MAG: (Fe-S)-binding protein [Methanothrix sp.]|nr:(Fe-S)-binding protein [Methanothrix sp.]